MATKKSHTFPISFRKNDGNFEEWLPLFSDGNKNWMENYQMENGKLSK
jgi:hypothetical protein